MSVATGPAVTPEPIFELAQGFMASKFLFVAGEIGLFEQLADGAVPSDRIAARLGLPSRSVAIVADALVALGLLTLDEGGYRNSAVAQTFLAGRGPADLRPLLAFWERLSYPAWTGLVEAVRRDGKQNAAFEFSPEDQAVFSAGVEAASSGGALALAASYDFGRHTRLLDVGGGTGSFAKIVRRRHPQLEATLFELPATAGYARTRFSPDDAAHIAVVEGNMLADALPPGHDVIVLAHILHGFNVEQNVGILHRAAAAAPAGGRLLLVDFFLDETRTSPVGAALMSGEFLMNTSGRCYSAAETRGWLDQAGWRFVAHRPLAGPVSVVVAER